VLDCNRTSETRAKCELDTGFARLPPRPAVLGWMGAMNCILIVDDNVVIRRSLRAILENEGWEVCGEASNGREAITKAHELHPDLIVLDISMPVMNGMDAAPELRKILPRVPIILFSVYADAIPEEDVAAAGITAIVPKADNMRTLIRIVRTLMKAA
jgi:DNA-binding NarL/FixJ family response regulator